MKKEMICDFCLKEIKTGQQKVELMQETETSKLGRDYRPLLVHKICRDYMFDKFGQKK